MRVVFLGPPGSGKGTQAKLLSEKLALPHISLGDILRDEVRQETEIGKQIKQIMGTGNLVPNEITNSLTKKRIINKDCVNGFILDGFPRNMVQAEALAQMFAEEKLDLDKVIYFHVSEDQVVDRLSGRRSCKQCGAVYHVKFNPAKADGKCDVCDGELYQRRDDVEAAIRIRFEVYEKQTKPLIEYYQGMNKLEQVVASGEIDEVFARLLTEVDDGN